MVTVGDAANYLVLANSAAFAVLFVLHAVGKADLFSASFQKEGFCVKNSGDAYWSSHATSFYVDCVGSAVLLGLFLTSSLPKSALTPIKLNVAGILAHGAGHMGLSLQLSKAASEGNTSAGPSSSSYASAFAVQFVFWLCLLKAADTHAPKLRLLASSVFHTLTILAVPQHYGFTYVQTVLLFTGAAAQLGRTDKDVYYDLFAVVVAVPIGFVSWLESFGCDAGFKQLGGHVYYDATIPLSLVVYYALAHAVTYRARLTAKDDTPNLDRPELVDGVPIKKIA